MRQGRQYSRREQIMLVVVICLVGGGVFVLSYFTPFYGYDDLSWELQGYAMIIRVPPQTPPYDQLFISPTGRVVRQLFLPPPGSEGVGGDLNLAEQQTVETLRSQWCTTTPTTHKQEIASSDYNIGINCGGFPQDKRSTFDRQHMPLQLLRLIARQPPLP